jgi:uncharacterized protein (DUF305 family)
MHLTRTLLPALAAGALLVAGCGDSSGGSASKATGNPVDRAFVAAMVPHHESAVEMARIARRRGSSRFVKQLADDIVRTQTSEIAAMRARDRTLAAAGVRRASLGMSEHMMGMDGDMARLHTAKPFDQAFLRMMIPHHHGAVVMAGIERRDGRDSRLRSLARTMIAAQQREIRQMRTRLRGSGHGSMHGGHGSMHGGDDSMHGGDDSMHGGASG